MEYTAPETNRIFNKIVDEKDPCTSASDVWSFGVLLWELYTNGQEVHQQKCDAFLYYSYAFLETIQRNSYGIFVLLINRKK